MEGVEFVGISLVTVERAGVSIQGSVPSLAVVGEFLDELGSRIDEEPVQAPLGLALVVGACDCNHSRSRSQYEEEVVDSGVGHPCAMSSESACDV
jgi:hypothetical protein